MPTMATTLARFLVCATLSSGCVFEPWMAVGLGDGGGLGDGDGGGDGGGDGDGDGPAPEEDADGDGYATPEDCDDGDAHVFPGQWAYFTVPTAAGSFDYNCNGTEELQRASFTTCDPPNCGDLPGWRINAPIPECGTEGEWDSGYCQPETEPDRPPYCSGGGIPSLRTQACR